MTALEAKLQLAALEADPSLVDEIWEGLMRELEADLISASWPGTWRPRV